MNRDVMRISEWPKWVDSRCKECGELVPRGYAHICDDKLPQSKTVEAKEQQ